MKAYTFEKLVSFNFKDHLTSDYLEWTNDKLLQKYIPSMRKTWDIEALSAFVMKQFEDPHIDFFAIIAFDHNKNIGGIHIGNAKLRQSSPSQITISLLIGIQEARYCGIGKEVINNLIQIVDNNYPHIKCIEAVVNKQNDPSQALFQSLWFERVGVKDDDYIYHYRYH